MNYTLPCGDGNTSARQNYWYACNMFSNQIYFLVLWAVRATMNSQVGFIYNVQWAAGMICGRGPVVWVLIEIEVQKYLERFHRDVWQYVIQMMEECVTAQSPIENSARQPLSLS